MFLLAMGYGCIASWLALCTSFPKMLACGIATVRAVSDSKGAWPRLVAALVAFEPEALRADELVAFYVLFVLCLMLGSLLTWLLSIHVPLALKNCTTVEGNYDNMPNPFDTGSDLRNLVQLLGKPGVDWLLPVRPFRPTCDGTAFPQDVSDFSSILPSERSGLLDFACTGDAGDCGFDAKKVVEDETGKPIAARASLGEADGSEGDEDFVMEVRWRNRYGVPLAGHGTSPLARSSSRASASAALSAAAAGPVAEEKDAPLLSLARWLDTASAFTASRFRNQLAEAGKASPSRTLKGDRERLALVGDESVRPCRNLKGMLASMGIGTCATEVLASDEVHDSDPDVEAMPIRGRDSHGGGGGGAYKGVRELHRTSGEEGSYLRCSSPRRPQRGTFAMPMEFVAKTSSEAPDAEAPLVPLAGPGERRVVAL